MSLTQIVRLRVHQSELQTSFFAPQGGGLHPKSLASRQESTITLVVAQRLRKNKKSTPLRQGGFFDRYVVLKRQLL
jgi:hypothetical protein